MSYHAAVVEWHAFVERAVRTGSATRIREGVHASNEHGDVCSVLVVIGFGTFGTPAIPSHERS
jgi:hypothetical protein